MHELTFCIVRDFYQFPNFLQRVRFERCFKLRRVLMIQKAYRDEALKKGCVAGFEEIQDLGE